MHGPPPTPSEIEAGLIRHARRPPSANLPYREQVLQAAEDVGVAPYRAFVVLGGPDW